MQTTCTKNEKLLVIKFYWIKDTSQFNEDFMKNYSEESNKGYFLEVDVQHFKKSNDLHNDLPYLPERIKIEKVEKLAANLHDKTEYVIQIINLKQAFNDGLVLKKFHAMIKFNQNVWLKLYNGMNTKLRPNEKSNFEKNF